MADIEGLDEQAAQVGTHRPGSVGRGRGELLLRLTLVLLVVLVAAAVVWVVRIANVAAGADTPSQVEPVAVDPDSAAPVEAVGAVPQGGQSGADPLRAWAQRLARGTEIPARALMAYGNAELAVRAATPRCGLSWATLAAIGRVESDHGRYGGAVLGDDGRPSTPIIGVPLDGTPGVRAITDTDGGAYDGDATVDRAVGPMQFIPSTWRKWTSDGNGDGVGDPQQIDDAALAAARYLCADGRDMTSARGWWQGVFAYNNSVPYGQQVFGLADRYARAAAS
ncbi:lytic transglycosylase domain-containing protein [Actinokineospora cianjurensis]|uniref:Transglycosylase protein with SLT domain n=1 Tax=Actinokineospora cianjurensis TaxID=585224 RepID=A0A421BD80_9PSEU|nr:transglycosylase protein with SLT domain [Actinokineospora cianjurensis]